MKAALFFHLLGVILWVGGMFFAFVCLRPVAAVVLEPPQRLRLWSGVFAKFFPWVWAAVVAILASGLYLLFLVGERYAPFYAYAMAGLGILMMLIFGHVHFGPFRRMQAAVAREDWPGGGAALGKIRILIAINLALGLLTVTVATLGAML